MQKLIQKGGLQEGLGAQFLMVRAHNKSEANGPQRTLAPRFLMVFDGSRALAQGATKSPGPLVFDGF